MQTECRIHQVHDLLSTMIERHPEFNNPELGATIATMQHVLCWVLKHDNALALDILFAEIEMVLLGLARRDAYEQAVKN